MKDTVSRYDIPTSENTLECARKAHERWIIKNNRTDLETAIEYYGETLKYNPKIPESYYRLAMLLWESGQISLASAIDRCKNAVKAAPFNVNARLYMGYFLKIANRDEEAEKQFKKAIKINPFISSRPRMNIGLLHSEKLFRGEVRFSHIIKSLYYLSSGILTGMLDYPCMRMGIKKLREKLMLNYYTAKEGFYKFTGNTKKALETLEAASKKTGRADIFKKSEGDILIRNEEPEKALEAYAGVLEVKPDDRETLLKTATVLQTYFEDRSDEAIDAYTRALGTEGDKDYIYYELGHLYLKNNDIINAVNAFKLACEENTMNAFFHNALGFALYRSGQYEEAEDRYLIAINLNPDSEWTATVCRALAVIYYEIKKNPQKAIRMYRQSLSLDSECAEAYISLGDIYFDLDEYDEAVKNYTEAIKLDGGNAYIYNKFATALWQKDFTDEAISAYEKAIEKDPEYAAAYNNLGVIYCDGKDNPIKAKNLFEKAIELNPEYTMAYFNAGRACQALKLNIESAEFYNKSSKLNQEHKELDDNEISERIHALFEV